jgi:hypothetical protein
MLDAHVMVRAAVVRLFIGPTQDCLPEINRRFEGQQSSIYGFGRLLN